jgi:D-arabinose 1-dehydrogenase-like Zn-dependent alcohol dehydrogenase
MRAAIFDEPGLTNLKVMDNVKEPDIHTANKEIKVKVWKKFKLDNVKEAIKDLSAKERDGRILLEIDKSKK